MAADVRTRGKIAQFHHSGRRGIRSRSFLPELNPLRAAERKKERKKKNGDGMGDDSFDKTRGASFRLAMPAAKARN